MKIQLQRWVTDANVWVDVNIKPIQFEEEFNMNKLLRGLLKKAIWKSKFRFIERL